MCGQCGCEGDSETTLLNLQTGEKTALTSKGGPVDPHEHVHADGTRHSHPHHHHGGDRHDQGHDHDPDGSRPRTVVIELEARILARNDILAAKNRGWFAGREILALNLVSSPGSGKTMLLERTIASLASELS